ncbi:hypothetical protein [Planctomicrobium sp. SH664]|uniref:hypothetical protein n=1 Tax=Planctomicrobium sp. SH664 TaxID=3448125 RepID=UPI003F5C33CD
MPRDDIIQSIQKQYRQAGPLNERERRQWAARAVLCLGRGGLAAVGRALHISANTIKKGLRELEGDSVVNEAEGGTRIRRPGGGRKSKRV